MILHYRQQRSFHRAFSRKKKTNPSGVPSYTIHLEDEINIRAEKHVGRCWTKILSFSVREPRPPQREGALILHYIISRIVSGVDARSRGTCAHMVSCRAQGEAPLLMQNREEEGGTIPLIVGRIFKFESRISLGPPAMGHRSQSIRGESLSLSLSLPSSRNKEPDSRGDRAIFPLFLSSPATRDAFACEKASLQKNREGILVTFGRSAVGKNFGFSRGEFDAFFEFETNEISSSFRDNNNIFSF